MICILLFWLAYSPPVPPPARIAVPRQEHLQHKKDSSVPAHHQKSVVTNSIADHIRRYFGHQTQQNSRSGATDQKINSKQQLARFYAARMFRTVWTKPEMVSELISAIDSAVDDGLNPADYHISEIREFINHPSALPELQARYDILLSDAFLSLASHLRYGKVDPKNLDPNWNINNAVTRSAVEYRLQNAIAKGQIAAVLTDLRPQSPRYIQLRTGLARYCAIAKEGGWSALPEGPTLTEGATDSRIPMLRKRLEASGEIAAQGSDTTSVYSKDMVDAVKKFQKRNGLHSDGDLGAATVKVMNISVEHRIDQIRINLDRFRWFIGDLEPTYVLVNIPDFTLQYVANGHQAWHTKVIVGQPIRETPVFKAEMQYIIFNPQWVIPPTILAKDALPGIQKSISYLSHKKLNVIDQNGTIVDPATLNWSQYTKNNFPYRLQQASGDQGSLGRIKFLLPNKHIVYLHDTPNKELFKKSARAFSSGCIRVENPLDLASHVLQDTVKWNKERITAAVNKRKTSTVTLPRRIPVFILYFTAFADGDDIQFRNDVYGKDAAVLNALNKPLPTF